MQFRYGEAARRINSTILIRCHLMTESSIVRSFVTMTIIGARTRQSQVDRVVLRPNMYTDIA